MITSLDKPYPEAQEIQATGTSKSEQAPGASEGQRSLACYSPRGHKESDMAERLNINHSNMM